MARPEPSSPTSSDPDVRIFEFVDYHAFLAAWIAARKARNPAYSYQLLVNRAGFKSRSFLRLVCLGQRDLSEAYALRLAAAMSLSPSETEYFLSLIALDNAETEEQRQRHRQRLAHLSPSARPRLLSSEQFDLFRHWWMIPLWEAACAPGWEGDWVRLAALLDPPITPNQAKQGVADLLQQGLLQEGPNGYFRIDANLHTRDRTRSRVIRNYQQETIELARRALDRIPANQRHIATMAIGLDAEAETAIIERLEAFRAEVTAIASRVTRSDRMLQLNTQLFPIARLDGSVGRDSSARSCAPPAETSLRDCTRSAGPGKLSAPCPSNRSP
jgi:uncharacterized protein (TIGR02147 family)